MTIVPVSTELIAVSSLFGPPGCCQGNSKRIFICFPFRIKERLAQTQINIPTMNRLLVITCPFSSVVRRQRRVVSNLSQEFSLLCHKNLRVLFIAIRMPFKTTFATAHTVTVWTKGELRPKESLCLIFTVASVPGKKSKWGFAVDSGQRSHFYSSQVFESFWLVQELRRSLFSTQNKTVMIFDWMVLCILRVFVRENKGRSQTCQKVTNL